MKASRLAWLIGVGLLLLCMGGLILTGAVAWANAGALASLASIVPGLGARSTAPTIGALAPEVTLETLDGRQQTLQALRGKAIVLNFWATWCGPCIAEMGNIEKVYQAHSGGELVVLAINEGENADSVRGFGELYRLNFPLLLDRKFTAGDIYRANALPTTVFVDRRGVIRDIHIGGPMSEDFIEGKIKLLMEQQ